MNRLSKTANRIIPSVCFVIVVFSLAFFFGIRVRVVEQQPDQNASLEELTERLLDAGIFPGMYVDGGAAQIYACEIDRIKDVVAKSFRTEDVLGAQNWVILYAWALEVSPGCSKDNPSPEPASYQAHYAYRIWVDFGQDWTDDAKRAARKYAEFILGRYRTGDNIPYKGENGVWNSSYMKKDPGVLEDALYWFEKAGAEEEELRKIRKLEGVPPMRRHKRNWNENDFFSHGIHPLARKGPDGCNCPGLSVI